MIENWAYFIRFLMVLVCFLVYVLYLSPKQALEVIRYDDWLNRLRWLILSIIGIAALSLIPSIVNLYFLSIGLRYIILGNISAITGGISLAATTLLMVLIFNYRKNK